MRTTILRINSELTQIEKQPVLPGDASQFDSLQLMNQDNQYGWISIFLY
ncbi:hypothetical protein H6G36_28195 [Anabaena minutissima FACHB-250]|nr:hypothetical protein [Anabaena minutissima FACHB-250]